MRGPKSALYRRLKFRSSASVSASSIRWKRAEMMVNPSEQAIGLNKPGVAGAINVSSPVPPRKAQIRRLKPIAG